MNADELLDMTIKQFFNGLQGKYEYDSKQVETQRNLLYSAIRFNASSISSGLSHKLARHISRMKFPWEIEQDKIRVKGSKFISYDAVKGSLNMISENKNNKKTRE